MSGKVKPAKGFQFTVSDTIAGYVGTVDRADRTFTLTTSGGDEYTAYLTSNTFARFAFNLGEPYADATGRIGELLRPGQFLYAYGIFYPVADGSTKFEAKSLIFLGDGVGVYRQEEPNWWVHQIHSIADSYLKWQFNYFENGGQIDYRDYRTYLHLAGAKKKDDFLQETDTISRMVYGMASAYLLTGEDRFLEAAEKGTEYLREHMRFYDSDEDLIYWYHGIQVSGDLEQKLLTQRVRRRPRRAPDVRADLCDGRPTPDLSRHGRPAHPR